MEGSLAPVYDRFLDFLVEKATPQEILSFTIPESERERALVLLDKRDTGSLSLEEAIELNQMQRVDQLISALKAKALAASKRRGPRFPKACEITYANARAPDASTAASPKAPVCTLTMCNTSSHGSTPALPIQRT